MQTTYFKLPLTLTLPISSKGMANHHPKNSPQEKPNNQQHVFWYRKVQRTWLSLSRHTKQKPWKSRELDTVFSAIFSLTQPPPTFTSALKEIHCVNFLMFSCLYILPSVFSQEWSKKLEKDSISSGDSTVGSVFCTTRVKITISKAVFSLVCYWWRCYWWPSNKENKPHIVKTVTTYICTHSGKRRQI